MALNKTLRKLGLREDKMPASPSRLTVTIHKGLRITVDDRTSEQSRPERGGGGERRKEE